MQLNTTEELIEDIRQGRMVILMVACIVGSNAENKGFVWHW